MSDMSDLKPSDNPETRRTSDEPYDVNDGPPAEYGGRKGKDPTRYGDWEKNGRCIDF